MGLTMFRSVKMRKVEIIAAKQDLVPVTEALAASGVFQPIFQAWEDGNDKDGTWTNWKDHFLDLDSRLMTLLNDLNMEPGEPPASAAHFIDPQVAELVLENIEGELKKDVSELEKTEDHIRELQHTMEQLAFIEDLDVDLETLRRFKHVFALPGTMPTDRVQRFSESLGHLPFVLVTLKRRGYLSSVVLFGHARDAQSLTRAARSAYLNPINLPAAYRGTPAEVMEAIAVSLKRAQQQRSDLRLRMAAIYHEHGEQLRVLLWRVRASKTLAETIQRYQHFRYTSMITGWVAQEHVQELAARIKAVSANVTFEVLESQPRILEKDAPILLQNPSFARAFQPLVTTYAYPDYKESDPTLLIALTFPLIFGIMFGDVGHGLLLGLLGLWLSRSKRPILKSMAAWGKVIVACGASAMLFGLLYGSIFGFEDILTPLWKSPLNDINAILLTTVGVGIGLLSLGMLVNLGNTFRTRRWGDFFFGSYGLVYLLLYWSLIILAFSLFGQGAGQPLMGVLIGIAVLTGLGVVFGEPLQRLVDGEKKLFKEGVGTYIPLAFFELFETLISFLSNTLSYVRMGAFAVAHGALSLTVFILAETVSPAKGWGYWLAVVLGNLFVVGFEGMIVAIQTLRLEYYEFFTKFYTGGGTPFKPLALFSRQ